MKKVMLLALLLVSFATAALAYSGKCGICPCPAYVSPPGQGMSCVRCGHSIAAQ